MSIFKPTYYGAVAQKSTQGTTAIDDQTQGSLTQLVLQPSGTSPSFTGAYNGTFQEVWKGPYTIIKDLPTTKFRVGTSRTSALTALGSTNYVARFSAPSAGKDVYGIDQDWFIDKVEVKELEAGDHAELRVTYKNYVETSGGGGQQQDPYQDIWSLNWQSYTVSPFAFCANTMQEDPYANGYIPDATAKASRCNIERFEQSPLGNKTKYEYAYGGRSALLCLNEAERKIFQKKIKGVNAQYHYPVLTHTQVSKRKIPSDISSFSELSTILNEQYADTIGNGIDHIMPDTFLTDAKCPYKFPTQQQDGIVYQWVKVGDQMTQTKTKTSLTFNRTQQYWGVISADVNLYGNVPFDHNNLDNCRWKVGEV